MTNQPVDQSPPLLQVEGLVKRFPIRRGLFGSAAVHAVEGVDLSIRRGEVLSLVGESGSGKSTLGACITGMSAPTEGIVRFNGQDVSLSARAAGKAFRRKVQPVFQDPRSSLDPRWPIERTIREPLDAYEVGTRAQRTARVGELMDLVGLPQHLGGRQPRELSGGQQQRVAIAAALALEPELLVADEPVSALDVSVQAQILNLLRELQSTLNLALLFISHDLSVVEHLSDRVAVMYLGRIVETGPVDQIFNEPRHPYTQALIDSIPHADPDRKMSRIRLTGEIPSPVNPPSGCRFHPRCPLAIERCSAEDPAPTEFGVGRFASPHIASCHVAAAAVPAPQPISASSLTTKGAPS